MFVLVVPCIPAIKPTVFLVGAVGPQKLNIMKLQRPACARVGAASSKSFEYLSSAERLVHRGIVSHVLRPLGP